MITNIITAVVTAYVTTGHPCANGKMPCVKHTIAAPRDVLLGSIVIIDKQRYTVEDRTAMRYNGRFDIFMSTKEEARTWGKQTKTITIITQ